MMSRTLFRTQSKESFWFQQFSGWSISNFLVALLRNYNNAGVFGWEVHPGSWLVQLGSLVCSKTLGCQVYVVSSIIAGSNDTKTEDMQLIFTFVKQEEAAETTQTVWNGAEWLGSFSGSFSHFR